MMRFTSVAVGVLLVLLLGACADGRFRASGQGAYPPFPGEVERLEQLPEPGSYELVGVVMVRGATYTSDARMYERLEDVAAQRGADAVVPQSKIKSRPTTGGGEERRLAGYAIRRR